MCAKIVLVGLYHLLDHLTTDATCLTGRKITVVTVVVKSYTNLVRSLHLKLLKCLFS